MQRVDLPSGKAAFPTALTEAEVRRLAGASAFAQGDAWQRSGHVSEAAAGVSHLTARVLGTWRRLSLVSAILENGQIKTRCTGEGSEQYEPMAAGLCRHAVALLLHWLREPTTFIADEGEQDDSDDPESRGPLEGESSRSAGYGEDDPILDARFAPWLETLSSNELRTIARRRNARVTAHTKKELVAQLAESLSQPDNIDAAVAGLDATARQMLYLIDLLGSHSAVTGVALQKAFYALTQSSDRATWLAALTPLVDQALVVNNTRQVAEYGAFFVPEDVGVRLPPWPDILSPVDRPNGGSAPSDVRQSVDIHQVLLVVLQAVLHGQIGKEARTIDSRLLLPAIPGWLVGSRDAKKAGMLYGQRDLHLVPMPPLLVDTDRKCLAQSSGLPLHEIDFAVALLLGLGVLKYSELRIEVDEGVARNLWSLRPRNRVAVLVNAWLVGRDDFDLGPLTRDGQHLELHFNPAAAQWVRSQPNATAVRNLVARLIMHLDHTQSHWYDLQELLDALWTFAPKYLHDGSSPGPRPTWWFADSRRGSERLDLDKRSDWEIVWAPLVTYILTGPLSWLGLVEVSPIEQAKQFFRLRPAAAILSSQEYEASPEAGSTPPAFDVQDGEPTITLPAGFDGEREVALLARYGDILDVSAHGVRYRLSRERIQRAFDDGLTGPGLIGILTGGAHPPSLEMSSAPRAIIEDWWARYGLIRLYDDVTLIELGDDVLLRELLVTSSLSTAMLHTLSPRTVAVHPSRVGQLLTELTRLGYTPRLVDGP